MFRNIPVFPLICWSLRGRDHFLQCYYFTTMGAHFSIGKEKMVRPFGVEASVTADADDWAERCYDKQYVGDYLASHGYVVLAVDALFWGNGDVRKECAMTHSKRWLPICYRWECHGGLDCLG